MLLIYIKADNYYNVSRLLHIFSEHVPELLSPKLDLIYTGISDKILPNSKITDNSALTFPVEIVKNVILNMNLSESNIDLMQSIEKDMIGLINKAPHNVRIVY